MGCSHNRSFRRLVRDVSVRSDWDTVMPMLGQIGTRADSTWLCCPAPQESQRNCRDTLGHLFNCWDTERHLSRSLSDCRDAPQSAKSAGATIVLFKICSISAVRMKMKNIKLATGLTPELRAQIWVTARWSWNNWLFWSALECLVDWKNV